MTDTFEFSSEPIPSSNLIGPTLLLTEEKIETLVSQKGYSKATSKLKDARSEPEKGYFFSYDYNFSLDYPKEVVDYFDKTPLILCFNAWAGYTLGINFHFIPVLSRSWLLSRIKAMNPEAFKKSGYNKVYVSYSTLQSIMKKSKYAVRLYRNDRIENLKAVTNKQMEELVKYSPPNYYKVSVAKVMERYRDY